MTEPSLPPCLECASTYTYDDGSGLLNCPECGHAWSASADDAGDSTKIYRDVNGAILKDGDTVTVIKDLKYGGGVVKVGTKAKNIRLVDRDHDIDCKIPGIGAISLKTEFVKKVPD